MCHKIELRIPSNLFVYFCVYVVAPVPTHASIHSGPFRSNRVERNADDSRWSSAETASAAGASKAGRKKRKREREGERMRKSVWANRSRAYYMGKKGHATIDDDMLTRRYSERYTAQQTRNKRNAYVIL